MTLDYFYGQAGELFAFYRIPKALFQEPRFLTLSTDAKTLYGILLDRMSLSVKNGWLDEQGRVFIIFTIEDVKRALCCADNKATKLLRELEKFGLIERKRRGLGKPSLVYVKNFSAESSKSIFQNRDFHDSGGFKIACQDPAKSRCNKTKENDTEMSETDPFYSEEAEGMSKRTQLEEYGAKRICNYLVEHNIMGRNGKNIPNITIGRMIRNKGYTGYLINGNVEKECPELRIIEPEVFEKAQELRDARRREKGEDADSYSPHALLCGKVFCAHCGNRLNITSSGRTRLRADGTVVKEKRYRYSCNFNVRHPGQCDGQSGYGVTTLDAVVESIVCMKFEEILECSKSNLLEEMRRKDLDAAKKEATRWKEEVQTKVDEQDALKKEMIRVIQGTSGLDREMIQQMVNENKEALLTAQTNLADSEKKLKEIEEQNQKAERNCSDLFTWASTYKGASFERRQAILKQFIKEVRVGRDYNIEIVLNVPLDEFEEFKRHAASAGRGKNQKNKSQNPQKVGRCTSNAGIVVLDKTAGETISIVPKNAAHAILRC